MNAAEHEVLACQEFPNAHRLQIHGANPPERLNAWITRRTNGVCPFPKERAVMRPLSAMLREQGDEWFLQRRYMPIQGLPAVSDIAPARLSAVQR